MLYRKMPKTNDNLSILGLGCMRLPGGRFTVDENKAINLIRHAIDNGINYIDTAWPYHGGKSELILGKALTDGYRKKVMIADKLPQWMCENINDMEFFLNEQLKRLGVESIDYYLMHAIDGKAWKKIKKMGVEKFIDQAKERGKIRNIGFSFHGPREEFKEIIDDFDWDFCQIQFNILDTHYQAGLAGLNYAWEKNIGVVIMEPLRGGALAGKQPKEVETIYKSVHPDRSNVDWNLRWIWNHPGVITVLSGMSSKEQLNENLLIASTAEINSMNKEELSAVKRAAEKFRALMKVPCTGCQYCMPCPHGVDIPAAFSAYNSRHLFKRRLSTHIMYLLQGLKSDGHSALAGECVNCGKCVKLCPQHINIPEELKNVKKEFEGLSCILLKPLLKFAMTKGRRKSK